MFFQAHQRAQLTTVAIVASVLSHAASSSLPSDAAAVATTDEILLLDEDIIQQAYYANSQLFAFDSSSLMDLQQLLQSDAFKQNMSLTLNISTENLTDLLNTAQLNQMWDFPHQQHTMLVLISLSVLYALIIVAGVVGNLITCVVIARNKFMHTATNYYLFNLALSDLMLLGTGAPQDVYSYWYPNAFPFNDAVCILASVLAETATNATVLTITAFTVERYIAICHPFRQHTMSKLSRAIKFIVAIWVTAVVLALPQAMQFSVVAEPSGTSCTIGNHFKEHVFAVSGFIFFVGPMTAICVLYILIGFKLKRSRMLQTAPRRHLDHSRGVSSQGRVIRMLFAVAVAFFLCWAPFHAQRLMAVYGSSANIESKLFKDVFDIVDMISGMMYYLSTCINPLLYNIMSHKFRDAFKVTLGRRFGLPGRSQSQSHNYSALLRRNGSMRLNTTVNSNALDHYQSYRVMQLHCRDPSHHLSLQDSIRTTTTTTTISSSSAGGGGGMGYNNASLRSSHNSRYAPVGTQSPHTPTTTTTPMTGTITRYEHKMAGLTTSQGPVVNGTVASASNTSTSVQPQHHRLLQTQLSQRSNGADSNLTHDMELGTRHNYYHPHIAQTTATLNSNRNNNFHRSLISNGMPHHNGGSLRKGHDDHDSINAEEWDSSSAGQYELMSGEHDLHSSDNTTRHRPPIIQPLQPHQPLQPVQPLQLVNIIAELDVHAPAARTRLKLSRVISRRDQDAALLGATHQTSNTSNNNRNMPSKLPNVADVPPDSPFMTYENDKKKHVRNGGHGGGGGVAVGGRTHRKAFDKLTGIFHWRARKKNHQNGRGGGVGGRKRKRNDSTSTMASTTTTTTTPATRNMHASRVGTPTPRVALMRSISAATAAPTGTFEATTLNDEMAGPK